ncbi:MAG: hypothetical protein ABL956_10790 [Hyphomonadaceae bacterium]
MRRLAALAALASAACGRPAPVDMKDPASVTRGFVAAYNVRDLSRMLPLLDQINLDVVKGALAGGAASEEYKSIFVPEMVELLARDGGKVDQPRYERNDAIVRVGYPVDGDVYTIELGETKDGVWLIEAFSTMSEAAYLALPTEPRKR